MNGLVVAAKAFVGAILGVGKEKLELGDFAAKGFREEPDVAAKGLLAVAPAVNPEEAPPAFKNGLELLASGFLLAMKGLVAAGFTSAGLNSDAFPKSCSFGLEFIMFIEELPDAGLLSLGEADGLKPNSIFGASFFSSSFLGLGVLSLWLSKELYFDNF